MQESNIKHAYTTKIFQRLSPVSVRHLRKTKFSYFCLKQETISDKIFMNV